LLHGLFGASVIGPAIVLLALAQFGAGIVSAFINWAVRTKSFGEIALNRLTQSAVLIAVQIGLGVVGFGAVGLVLGAVAGSIAGSTRLARVAWQRHAATFRQVSWSGMARVASRYRRFPIFSSGAALIANLGLRAPLLLLVALFGPVVGGQYALAERVCYLPVTLIAGAVGHQVFIADSARLAREDPNELRQRFYQTTLSLAVLAIVPAILVAVAAPLLAGPVFGDEWREAGVLVAILVPMFYAAFVFTSTGDVLYVVERQALHLVREILRLGFLCGSLVLAALLHLPAIAAVALLSASGCVLYVIYGMISWRAIATYRSHPHPYGEAPDPPPDPAAIAS
jgi:O-antigen/teichoic acid export membrane protein